MTHATAPRLTLTAAKAAAKELGFTMRKTAPGESEIVVYRKGAGMDSPAAYFTDCPVDALAIARAMAADSEGGRVTLTGKPATATAFATVAAEDNAKAAADFAADFAGDVTAEARRLTAEAAADMKAGADCPAAFDAGHCHYDATRAAMLYGRAIKATCGHGRRARLQEARDAATALAALAFELMIQAAKRDAGALAALVPEAEDVPACDNCGGAGTVAEAGGLSACIVCNAEAWNAEEWKAPEDVDSAIRAATVTGPHARPRFNPAVASHRAEARAEGHAAEERADRATGEERAAELDKAADSFDRAAMPAAPGGVANGHYKARATACREEAAAVRARVELDKPRPRSLSAAANPAAPMPRKARLQARKRLQEEAAGEGIAAELAALSLAALPPLASDSGGFPLYAFRDRRAIDPEELDSMAYGRSTSGLV